MADELNGELKELSVDELVDLRSVVAQVLREPTIQEQIQDSTVTGSGALSHLLAQRDQLYRAASSELTIYQQADLAHRRALRDYRAGARDIEKEGQFLEFLTPELAVIATVLGLLVALQVISGDAPLSNSSTVFALTIACLPAVLFFTRHYRAGARQERRAERIRDLRASLKVDELEQQLQTAREAAVAALKQKGLHPALRDLLSSAQPPSYAAVLPDPLNAEGLSEVFDPSFEITTGARDQLERLLESMPGGSIGVAGPRGAGKTTLLQSFCANPFATLQERRLLAVMTSAPVQYDARDFILNLFASLCQRVIAFEQGVASLTSPLTVDEEPPLGLVRHPLLRRATLQGAARPLTTTLLLVGGLMVLLAFGLAQVNVSQPPPTSTPVVATPIPGSGADPIALAVPTLAASPTPPPTPSVTARYLREFDVKPATLFWWGLGAVALGSAIFIGLVDWSGLPPFRRSAHQDGTEASSPAQATLEAEARDWLRKLRFQQSFSSGWSGALKAPIGVDGGINAAMTLSKNQLSLPEVIAGYRDFVDKVGQKYSVIVAIDELDKIGSDEKAEQFMNDIKAIFGLPRCFYIVSVSENAMSNFERRGLPFRDVFDSSFDNIIYVDYLDLVSARRLLGRRIVGLPVPFVALCFCMSGGLARDLIRACRLLMDRATPDQDEDEPDGERTSLRTLSASLVKADVALKLRALSVAAAAVDLEAESGRLLTKVREAERIVDGSSGLLAYGLLEVAGELLSLFPDAATPSEADETNAKREPRATARAKLDRLATLSQEVGVYLYYCATIAQFFRRPITDADWIKAESRRDIEELVRGRRYLAINPRVARTLINEFRVDQGMPVPATFATTSPGDLEAASEPAHAATPRAGAADPPTPRARHRRTRRGAPASAGARAPGLSPRTHSP